MDWQPIETAPRGGGAELVTDPAWVEPPRILLVVEGKVVIAYWDWYYAPGGNGNNGTNSGWVLDMTAETLDLHFGKEPTHWMPLPNPPATAARQSPD